MQLLCYNDMTKNIWKCGGKGNCFDWRLISAKRFIRWGMHYNLVLLFFLSFFLWKGSVVTGKEVLSPSLKIEIKRRSQTDLKRDLLKIWQRRKREGESLINKSREHTLQESMTPQTATKSGLYNTGFLHTGAELIILFTTFDWYRHRMDLFVL